jgi:UDP-glucose 4-epimerase
MTAALIAGAGGMLGRALGRELAGRGQRVVAARVAWGQSRAAADLTAAVRALADRQRPGQWSAYWCAGAGVVATRPADLAGELETFGAFAAAIAQSAADGVGPGAVFVASSAGGAYAGSAGPPFDEATQPRPLAAYGRLKLDQEAMAKEVLGGRVPLAIGRIANLYGPGQNLAKPQGLISHLCLAHHSGRPLGIYVPLDTRRDYLYVADAAAQVAALADVAAGRGVGAVALKVLASGRSVTIATLLGELRRIGRRPPRVIVASSAAAQQQAVDLRLRSRWGPEIDALADTALPGGIAATMEDIGLRWRRGEGRG